MSLTNTPARANVGIFHDEDDIATPAPNENLTSTLGPAERCHRINGQKANELMAMAIGLTTKEGRQLGNTDEEPYASMKFRKKVVPTSALLIQEIKRRCMAANTKQPACKNWDKKKLVKWMQLYPLTEERDVKYVIEQEQKLFDLSTRMNEERASEKKQGGHGAWAYPEPWIRVYECILSEEVRDLFVKSTQVHSRDELDARNSSERPETIWEAAARLYNDSDNVVLSSSLPDLHSAFAEVLDCSFEKMPGLITPDEIKRRFGDSRARLIKMISRWEQSGNGFGQRNEDDDDFGHIGENELQCGDNRASYLDSMTREHVLYLWHLADREEILKNVLSVIAEGSSASSTSCPSVAASAEASNARKRRKDEKYLAFFRSRMSLSMVTLSRASLFKELRETQDKETEYSLKVLEATSQQLSDVYMSRLATLREQIKIIQETIDEMHYEEFDESVKRSAKKKKKTAAKPKKKKAIVEDPIVDSDDSEEEGN
ncbi:unknown protein [Seminavis robusta]|uniref:Uncharacterized protein n=1 Tax=Seminavis robusta TaxID=568900 RepID=A0A9N8H734_9STRA|nr:unknown protein [Seminavis robusta]|eukprot:Sro117_g057530.1 n/a (487) ;mRNA; f:110441-111901